MVLRFRCKQCDKRLKAGPQFAGARVRCPRCGAMIVVPSAAAPADGGNQDQPPTASAAADASREEPDTMPSFAFGRRRLESDDELDMTPMVDVTFLLLIFFMMTAAFALQKSIEMPTPDRQEEAAQQRTIEDFEEEDYIIVRIDSDDTVWVEDAEAPSEQDLLSRLRELRRGEGANGSRPANSMLVLASGDARHEVVVRVLDAGHAVNMENVRLATVDDDAL